MNEFVNSWESWERSVLSMRTRHAVTFAPNSFPKLTTKEAGSTVPCVEKTSSLGLTSVFYGLPRRVNAFSKSCDGVGQKSLTQEYKKNFNISSGDKVINHSLRHVFGGLLSFRKWIASLWDYSFAIRCFPRIISESFCRSFLKAEMKTTKSEGEEIISGVLHEKGGKIGSGSHRSQSS